MSNPPRRPEKVKIAIKLFGQRLDHRQCGGRSLHFAHCDGAVERHHRRRLQPLKLGIELVDLGPVGLGRLLSPAHARPR